MSRSRAFPTMHLRGRVRNLVLVLGDQLDRNGAAPAGFDNERDAVLMMEVAEESVHVPSHRQRTVLFLSAMRHFAREQRERDRRVHYIRLDESNNAQNFDDELRRQVKRLKPKTLICTHPGEWRVLELMHRWRDELPVEVRILPDEHFLVGPEAFEAWANGRKQFVLEHFYRRQRQERGILMTRQGEPEGGRWNFDEDNRRSFKSEPEIRRPYRPRPDDITAEVIETVERRLPDLPGRLESFHWPVTRAEAKRALKDFIEHRLAGFGPYEDAMWTGETTVYHSRLSAALNLKLLQPMECVDAALEAWRAGDAPINSVEGFVRQIIGWREFIRGLYWQQGPDYGRRNALDQHGALPGFYWTGETDMECMRQALGQVLDEAYGHHIQRLMVTGNFALISGVHPRVISDWYLGMYIDAVDWATLPNTLGMAMHADGGVVGSKPYAASGRYIRRMSNYCAHCPLDVSKRSGEGACPFNTFYWDFLIRHRKRFAKNQRMSMILRNVDRLAAAERTEITREGRRLREVFGIDGA
ncbi:MAG: cryptochrome/photolyase family protein [Planctomycetota bacterium]|nr:cryptochrome/photolyase family protein [Planctomycetota bacterium]